MSLDSESPSPSTGRDWFFPSPSFIHHPHLPRTPTRRFSTNPRARRPYDSDPKHSSFQTLSPPTDPKYAGIRRRVDFARRTQRSDHRRAVSPSNPQKFEVTSSPGNKFSGIGAFRLNKARWQMAFSLPILITAFSSLLHKIFSYQNQIIDLQDHISKLNVRLRACTLVDSVDIINSIPQESDHLPNKSLKISVLIALLTILSIPFLFFKYVEHVSKSRRSSSDNIAEEVSLNKQLAYRVDVFLSVHPYAKPLALLIATLLLICLGGLALFGVTDDSLADSLWLSWTYVADSGNHTNSEGVGPRLVSVSISFGGMLIFAMMLGLVSDAISEKLDSLRKGRSEVVEQNHTLILGWSDKLGSLLNQLAMANESLGGGIVVVMAERDKEEMETDIAKMEFDFRGTSVISRSGSPLILADLKKVSVSKARAIIVLAEDGHADQSDARALRTVLSLIGVKGGLRGHIVVELSDLENKALVKFWGGDLVETVVSHDVIGRLMIQCARQPGLAQIWEGILGFENCEFYIKRWPQLDGMQFEDALISFPDAIPCGIKAASYGGKIILNPDDSHVLQEGDEVLVIAEDDDTFCPTTLPTVWRGNPRRDFNVPKSAERILFCGWRRDMGDMIMVLDYLLAPGSTLWMFNDVPEEERVKKLIDGGLDINCLVNISLVNRKGNAVIRRHLQSLPLESFDSIIILADESVEDSASNADSRSLATYLLIRDIQAKRLPYREAKTIQRHRGSISQGSWGGEMQQASDKLCRKEQAKRLLYREAKTIQRHRVSISQGSWGGEMQQASDKSVIISEILDPRTKNLLSMLEISDYVLSNELVSMVLAMVAEDRQINDVLEELFAEGGNDMHIRQADLYLRDGEELSFYEVLLRARQRREIVIGYRLANAEKAVINPPGKNEKRRWSLEDVFVVFAKNK